MTKTDFRHRLKNHKAEFNPSAWEQMSDMLESIPSNEKKKRGWWLFLISIMLLSIIVGYVLNSNTAKQQTKADIFSQEDTTTKYEISKSKIIKSSSQENSLVAQSSIKKKKELKKVKKYDLIAKSTSTDATKTIFNNPYKQVTKRVKNPGKTKNKNNINGYSINRSKIINNNELSNTPINNEVYNKKTTSKQKSNFGLNNSRFIALEKIDIKNKSLKYQNDSEYNGIIENLIPNYGAKLNKFFFAGKVGYAQFNSSPGFHIGAGIIYRVNKLVYLESEIGYSYGSERSLTFNGVFHREYQYEANIITILNLISIKKFNIAFELGAGYTIYRGRRVLFNYIDYRHHSGLNLQGGLSLSYFINAEYGIGFKWGIISYDDGVSYLALRFTKRF